MEPQQFIERWRNTSFGERQGAQSFFNDICAVVDHSDARRLWQPRHISPSRSGCPAGLPTPTSRSILAGSSRATTPTSTPALSQLLRYQLHLKTPPLLIVSSFRTIRIQTNFPGMETVRHEIPVAALDQREQLDKLRRVFHAPADFRPDRTLYAVTKDTADLFYSIVRGYGAAQRRPGKAGPISESDNVLSLRRGCPVAL